MIPTFVPQALRPLAAALSLLLVTAPLRAEVIVVDDATETGAGTPGGKANPSLTPEGWNNVISTWINTRANGDRHAYVGYFTRWGTASGTPTAIGSSGGPTAGKNAASAAVVGLSDLTSLVFFSADARSGGAGKRDIFVQRMSSSRTKTGNPKAVNTVTGGAQDRLLAVPLSNGGVLAVWQSHGGSPGSNTIRGRVLSASGSGITPDRALTKTVSGGHIASALAALKSGGGAVLAYFVKDGTSQKAYLQRLDADAKRVGAPILLKKTAGSKTYGGAGVSGRNSGAEFLAAWFAPASGGKAELRLRFFKPDGKAAKTVVVDKVSIRATSQNAPRVLETGEGIVIVADVDAGGKYAIDGWLVGGNGKLLAYKRLVTRAKPISVGALTSIPSLDIYFAGFTEKGGSAKADKAILQAFHVETGCSVKC